MKHCLSQYYSLKLLFKATLSLKIPTLFTILLLFIPVLFIIRMDINSIFLFSKLLPMKVRNRRCMSDAKHRMKHNQSWSWHAIEWCYHEGSWTGWNKSKQQPPRWQCHWLIEEQKLERMYTYDELRERTKLDSKVLSSQSCIMVYMWHSWSNKLIIYNMYFNRATITCTSPIDLSTFPFEFHTHNGSIGRFVFDILVIFRCGHVQHHQLILRS